ncbi:MAG: hypothetical protein IKQ09_06275 [Bacteroidales bacterium]|nr:hypothetical protein [Bacteroidales bacterium]
MRTLRIINEKRTRPVNTKTKVYPQAPEGCISLEEFSDRLEETILRKI